MENVSRRGLFAFFAGAGATVVAGGVPAAAVQRSAPLTLPRADALSFSGRGATMRAALKARLGDDIFTSWFKGLEFESFDAKVVTVSVPVKFLRSWINHHYYDELLDCCRAEFKTAEGVVVALRQSMPVWASARNRIVYVKHIS